MEYLNRDRIEQVSHESFQRQQPYPWVEIGEILTHEGHDLLRQTLPDASMFDRKVGVKRAFGQGYHDRYILHYHPSLDVAEPWKEFVAELHGRTYEALVRRMFGLGRGCALCPHSRVVLRVARLRGLATLRRPPQAGHPHLLLQYGSGLGFELGRPHPDHGRRRTSQDAFSPGIR